MADFPIIDFSWQQADLVELRDPTVSELEQLARVRAPYPFVAYDPVRLYAAVVLPEAVLETLGQLGVPANASVYESGLMRILSEDQLTVDPDAPAVDVVRQAVQSQASVVLLVGADPKPTGVFIPSSAAARLRETMRTYGYAPETWFGAAMPGRGEDDPTRPADAGLVSAIEAISRGELERYRFTFHSENINRRNPVVGVCPDHGRSHITPLPCNQHSSVQARGAVEIR